MLRKPQVSDGNASSHALRRMARVSTLFSSVVDVRANNSHRDRSNRCPISLYGFSRRTSSVHDSFAVQHCDGDIAEAKKHNPSFS